VGWKGKSGEENLRNWHLQIPKWAVEDEDFYIDEEDLTPDEQSDDEMDDEMDDAEDNTDGGKCLLSGNGLGHCQAMPWARVTSRGDPQARAKSGGKSGEKVSEKDGGKSGGKDDQDEDGYVCESVQ
jgi:hypothetical protein